MDNLCTFKMDPYFLNPFFLTEGSDSYYPPREEETNEIERQQSQVHATHIRTRADDSDRNEVISTQQMCKTSALFTETLKFTWLAYSTIFFFNFFIFVFCLFRAIPKAHGGSQARGQIGAVAAGLHHSHSNARSEPHLQPTPQLTATPEPLPTEQGQGLNPGPHGS